MVLFFYSSPQRAPPPVPISIPNFPYPPTILQYLISQSAGLKITYVPPGSVKAIPLQPSAPVSSSDTPEVTPSTWVEATVPPMYSGGGPPGTVPSSTSTVTTAPTPTPTIPLQPAYSNPTSSPQKSSQHKNSRWPIRNQFWKTATKSKTAATKSKTAVTAATPVIWKAAIQAMEYTQHIKKITSGDKMNQLYADLRTALSAMNNTSALASQNAATLLYFCTVITILFQPFNKFISYNYLNRIYPTIFPDSKSYRKFCMVNFYCIQASQLFTKNTVLNQYINVNNRVMKYMVPPLLQTIMYELQQ